MTECPLLGELSLQWLMARHLEPGDCSNSVQNQDRCWLNFVNYNVLCHTTRCFTMKTKWCCQTCTTCLLSSEAYSPPLNLNFLYLPVMYSTSTVIWPYEFNSIHCEQRMHVCTHPYPLIYLDFSSIKYIVNFNFVIVQ